jgi:hypothetical protein
MKIADKSPHEMKPGEIFIADIDAQNDVFAVAPN